jgi:hypothetical protein
MRNIAVCFCITSNMWVVNIDYANLSLIHLLFELKWLRVRLLFPTLSIVLVICKKTYISETGSVSVTRRKYQRLLLALVCPRDTEDLHH